MEQFGKFTDATQPYPLLVILSPADFVGLDLFARLKQAKSDNRQNACCLKPVETTVCVSPVSDVLSCRVVVALTGPAVRCQGRLVQQQIQQSGEHGRARLHRLGRAETGRSAEQQGRRVSGEGGGGVTRAPRQYLESGNRKRGANAGCNLRLTGVH